jgi:hypothetical protein
MTNKKWILLILLFFLFFGCKSPNHKSDNLSQIDLLPAPCEESSNPLDIVGSGDTLEITIEFSDCGEWGGHKEMIYLQSNKQQDIIARFIMDTVSCDKIVEKHGVGVLDDNNRHLIIDTVKVLNNSDEKLFSLFFQRLLELYLKNEMHANAGARYYVRNTNNSFNIDYWNSGDCRDTYYGNIRNQVFGDIIKTINK